MMTLKLTPAHEISLTPGLFQIKEFEVVPAPASRVMLQCKYEIYQGLMAPGYLFSSDARLVTHRLCATVAHNKNTASFPSSCPQLRQL
jgi:hypothetical protein